MWDSIFGTALTSGTGIGLANQQINTYSTSAAAQQAQQAYTNYMGQIYNAHQNRVKWVYNGIDCTLEQFAELMWPDDEQARLMFVLKHGGV